jgi:hypothetical protein
MPVKNRNMVTAPKKRLVGKQPHLLAYITPAEAALLKKNGGTGEMVDGIPAFRPVSGRTQGRSNTGTGFSGGSSSRGNPADRASGINSGGSAGGNQGYSGGGGGGGNNNNDNDNDGPSAAEIAAANAAANAAAEKAARELAAANAQREKAAAEAKAVADAEAKRIADAEAKAVADAEAKAIADQAAIDAAALATSPTDVSNVYNFYETDPVVDYTADDLNLGIGAVDPVTTTTTSPTDASNVYDFYEPDISLDAVSTTTYPAPPPDPILPDDRGYPDVYDPTPFEGPATDDDLGLTDAPISDYYNTEDPYEPNLLDPQTDDDLGFDTYDDTDIFDTDPYSPNLMDAQTDDDLGFETPLDTTDIFGPDANLIQDPVTGYVRPMTVQEIEQGAFDTRFSYAAPDNVLNQDIGDLSSATFDTGAAITGPSPTDTANAYNFDNIAGVDPFTDTTDFNIGGDPIDGEFVDLRLSRVDTTAPSGLTGSTDLLGDPINLGTLSPTDQSGMGVEFDSTTPNAGAGFTDATGVGTETPFNEDFFSVTRPSPSGYNSAEDASDYNQSFDPTDPTGFVSPADTTKYDDKTVSTTTVSPTDLSNVYDFYNEPAANPLRLELTDPASGLDYADGSPNNIAFDDAIASEVIGRDLDNADEPVLDPDTGKPMLTDKGKPITYGVAPRFSGGGFAGFIRDLISFVVKGATYGAIDINKMDEKYKEKLWDAYQAGGTWAYDEKGKIVGITDENGKLLNIGGGGADGGDGKGGDGTGIVNVCEPGYVLVNGVCVPEDGASTGADDGYGGTFGGPIIRPTTPTTPRTPVVTQPTLPAPTVRKPKQFAMGGEVSPGLITAADRFLASLKG